MFGKFSFILRIIFSETIWVTEVILYYWYMLMLHAYSIMLDDFHNV